MKRRNQAGQVLIGTAVAMVVLAGFAGLAIDMGTLRYQKRLQQTAADGGAIAGASNLVANSGVIVGARAASSNTGFTDTDGGAGCVGASVGCVSVTVNIGPATGPHAGNTKYVEVLVTAVQPTYFMKVFGIDSETVTARAVATNLSGGTNSGCLYTLGLPNAAIEGININGSVVVNAKSCGIVDNGNYNTKGNALQVTAATFAVAGDKAVTGSGGSVTCVESPTSCPTLGTPTVTDPLAKLTPPCSPCTGGTAISIDGNGNFSGTGVTYANNTYTISPGTYTAIGISGTGGGNTVVFSPGLYIIDGSAGITIPGNATITGDGVTFYFTNSGTINETGNPTMHLTAPDSTGQYPGILFYQDPADTTGPTLGGNTGSFYDGVLYFPKAQITFFGNNNSVSVAMVVADALAFSGNPTVTFTGSAGLPPGVSVITNATLVE
jgi:Putative Flp pilus-assembly TadE/G-like